MACDKDEGPPSHGGQLKRPVDFEDGDSISIKKARLSSSADLVDPSDVLDSLSEKSNGIGCPTEAISNGRESNNEQFSNSDDMELRVSPGSTHELLNGSVDLESVQNSSANGSELDDLLSSSEVEESQNELADEDALLASPSREYGTSNDIQRVFDDEEHGIDDVDNECKELDESKDLLKQECYDIGRSNSHCGSVSESEDVKPLIESSSSLCAEGEMGERNGNTTNSQLDKDVNIAGNVKSESDFSVESVNGSLRKQSDTSDITARTLSDNGELTSEIDNRGGAGEISASEDAESELRKENEGRGIEENDMFVPAQKEPRNDKKITSPLRSSEDRSEDLSEPSTLMIDEASLDGSSMRLLDDLTSSTDELPSRNDSRVVCDGEEVSMSSPCAKRVESESLKVTDKEMESESDRTSSEIVGHDVLEKLPDKVAESSAISGTLTKVTRKELEEAILRKVAQSIGDKNEVRTLLERVKKETAELAAFERKYQTMYKQMSDLAVVFKRYVSDRKNNPQAGPAKITRGVGVQVRIDGVNSTLANSTVQPTSQVAADTVQKKSRGHSVKQNPAPSSNQHTQRQTTPTKAVPPPLTPTSPRRAASRPVPAASRPPSTTPVSSSPQAQSSSRPLPQNHRNQPSQMAGPRVATVTAPQALQATPRQPEVTGTPKKVIAPMVAIPPEAVERASAASTSTISTHTETVGHQEKTTLPPKAHQHQTYTMRQPPVVAKVTLPSNVTEMLEAQAAAKRAAAAQRPAAPQGARQIADDVIDLTDEDDSSFSVVQRSSSISQTATTVSSQIIQSDVTLRRNLTSASRVSTISVQSPRGSTTSSQRPQHPAPLPPSPPNPRVALHLLCPPKPKVTLTRKGSGICITWNMDLLAQHADIKLYHIYVYQESQLPPSTSLWKYIGEIQALPLPMACTLKQFTAGHRYHFAVKAKDKFDRFGLFSDVVSIVLVSTN